MLWVGFLNDVSKKYNDHRFNRSAIHDYEKDVICRKF